MHQFNNLTRVSKMEIWTAAASGARRRFSGRGQWKSAVAAALCQRSPKAFAEVSRKNWFLSTP
jgi:hypothetical protein